MNVVTAHCRKRPVSRCAVLVPALLLALAVSGCSTKFIADYDPGAVDAIISAARTVDLFYGRLMEADEDQRPYHRYIDDWVTAEAELKGLALRNKIRSVNAESARIAEDILGFWLKYKKSHKKRNEYKQSLAEIHRERFAKLFFAMGKAEEAKLRTTDQ